MTLDALALAVLVCARPRIRRRRAACPRSHSMVGSREGSFLGGRRMHVETSRNRRQPGVVLGLVLVLALVFTGVAAAQGTQSGTLSGVVKSADGSVLPGVTVTLKSPALQGERTAVPDTTGAYIFPGLP